MNDETSGDTTPEVDANQSQADTKDSPAESAAATTLSLDDARKLRSEAKNLRDRLKDAEGKLKEREDSDLTATQKLEREKTALAAEKAQLETRLRDVTVQAVAAKVGVKADLIDTVSVLIDWDEVTSDDQKGIERAVKNLIKDRPSLSARPEGLDGGNGRRGQGDGGGDMDSAIRRAAGRA